MIHDLRSHDRRCSCIDIGFRTCPRPSRVWLSLPSSAFFPAVNSGARFCSELVLLVGARKDALSSEFRYCWFRYCRSQSLPSLGSFGALVLVYSLGLAGVPKRINQGLFLRLLQRLSIAAPWHKAAVMAGFWNLAIYRFRNECILDADNAFTCWRL